MFIIDDITGNMTLRQGDTYEFIVEGVTNDWVLYYSVYNANREILFEIHETPVSGLTTFRITAAQSDLMTVPLGKKTETYYYGLKRCKGAQEDTLIVGDKNVGDLNKITVYPLTTEGVENGAS